jgi:ATP-dependent exoDNAse (exonuclease V) alpha subunit
MQGSYLWQGVRVLKLKQNMRLGGPNASDEDKEFAQWLLEVGQGRNSDNDGNIKLPINMKLPANTQDALIQEIYPGLQMIQTGEENDQYFLERTILSARNDDVDNLNHKLLDKFPGEEKICMSADSTVTEEGVDADTGFEYPTEYLNSIKASGFPLAKLALKEGCPIMVLRNLAPAEGLCNGSRGILTRVSSCVLEIRLIGGDHRGKTAFIPRITLIPSEKQVGISMKRRQFPVRLAFSMTINKAQGQSVDYVGLDLRTDVFAHGQLYVALSQCTSSHRVKALFILTSMIV